MVAAAPSRLMVAIGGGVVPCGVIAAPQGFVRVKTTEHYDVTRRGKHSLDNREIASCKMHFYFLKSVGVAGIVLEPEFNCQVLDSLKVMAVIPIGVTVS